MPTLPATAATTATATAATTHQLLLASLPTEIHVNILTYLRAHDLASVQQTCRLWSQADLVHCTVAHTATRVYPAALTRGFDQQPVRNRRRTAHPSRLGHNRDGWYTYEHLRNMELLVIARVLAQPEPAEGVCVCVCVCVLVVEDWVVMVRV
jgi:hypothetical protein